MSKTCSIIGNGPSRQWINLNNIPRPTFGCNAIHRTFVPDYLVAIDPLPTYEILSSSHYKKFLPTIFNDQFEDADYIKTHPNRCRNNAGMVAMQKAIDMGFETLQCYGLDFIIDDVEMNMGNIFYNTFGYDGATSASYEDILARVEYFTWFANKHNNISFKFYVPTEFKMRNIVASNVQQL
jgi:hypothetical protein